MTDQSIPGPQQEAHVRHEQQENHQAILDVYLAFIIPLLKNVSDVTFQLTSSTPMGLDYKKYTGLVRWMGEMYGESHDVPIPQGMVDGLMPQALEAGYISPEIHLYMARRFVGRILGPIMPCQHCEGLGVWRGQKKGYTRYGRMVHLLGDPRHTCHECGGIGIDPEWRAKLEENPAGTFDEYRKLKGQRKLPRHFVR